MLEFRFRVSGFRLSKGGYEALNPKPGLGVEEFGI